MCYTCSNSTQFQGKVMRIIKKNTLIMGLLVAIGLNLTGCVNKSQSVEVTPPTPKLTPTQIRKNTKAAMSDEEKSTTYSLVMKSVGAEVKNNPKYNRMDLKEPNDNRGWFKESTYHLWEGLLTKEQFINAGLRKYPNNHYEFNFIATSILDK